MQSKIESLIEIYKDNKGKYLFDEVDNLEFDENGNINISLSFANGKYNIFIFLLNENKIIFKGLYLQSDKDLTEKYGRSIKTYTQSAWNDARATRSATWSG